MSTDSGSGQSTYSWGQINNVIPTVRSMSLPPIMPRSWHYHVLYWMVTVPVVNTMTRNKWITTVGFSPSLLWIKYENQTGIEVLSSYFCVNFWKNQLCNHTSSRKITYLSGSINKIATTVRSMAWPPRTPCSWPYHMLYWIVTLPVMNKVTRNRRITKVGLPPSLLHIKCENVTVL